MASGNFGWGGKCYASALVADRQDGGVYSRDFRVDRSIDDSERTTDFVLILPGGTTKGTSTTITHTYQGTVQILFSGIFGRWTHYVYDSSYTYCYGPWRGPDYYKRVSENYNLSPINHPNPDIHRDENGTLSGSTNYPFTTYPEDRDSLFQAGIDSIFTGSNKVLAEIALANGPDTSTVTPTSGTFANYLDCSDSYVSGGEKLYTVYIDNYSASLASQEIKVRYYSTLDVNWVDMGDGTERAVESAQPLFFIPKEGFDDVDISDANSYTLYRAHQYISNIDNPVTWEDPSESGVTNSFISIGLRDNPISSSDIKVSYGKWWENIEDINPYQHIELFDFDEGGVVIGGSIDMSQIIQDDTGWYYYSGGNITYRTRNIPVLPPDPPSEEEVDEEDPEFVQENPDEYWKVRVRHKPEFPTRTRTSKLVDGEYFRKIVRDLNHDRLNFQAYIDTPFEFDSTGSRNDLEDVKLGRQSTNDMEGFEDRRVLNLAYNDTKVNGSVMTAKVGTPSLNEVKQPAGLMENQEAMLCFKRICEPMILNTEIEMYNKAGTLIKKKTHRHQVNYKPNENQTHNTDEILGILNT